MLLVLLNSVSFEWFLFSVLFANIVWSFEWNSVRKSKSCEIFGGFSNLSGIFFCKYPLICVRWFANRLRNKSTVLHVHWFSRKLFAIDRTFKGTRLANDKLSANIIILVIITKVWDRALICNFLLKRCIQQVLWASLGHPQWHKKTY